MNKDKDSSVLKSIQTNQGVETGVGTKTEAVILPNKTSSDKKKILVILQAGGEDGGRRATLAFAIGVSSVLAKNETTIFLMGNGVVWARKGEVDRVNINGYEPLATYFSDFMLNSGNLLASIPCMQYQEQVDALLARRDVVAFVEYAGLTTLVHLTQESSVLTF